MLLISDKFNYEGHFSFLYKNLELNCMFFMLHLRRERINGLTIQAWNTFHNDSWYSTIDMGNLICSNITWVHQCKSIDSYKCSCMIFIIQLVYQIELLNTTVFVTVHIYKWAILWFPLLRSHHASLSPSQQEISHSWEPHNHMCMVVFLNITIKIIRCFKMSCIFNLIY